MLPGEEEEEDDGQPSLKRLPWKERANGKYINLILIFQSFFLLGLLVVSTDFLTPIFVLIFSWAY